MTLRIADMCGADTGGQSIALSSAVSAHTRHVSRSFRTTDDYMAHPYDFHRGNPACIDQARRYLRTVDVVHVHNKYRYASGWGPINSAAAWLIHQHGRPGSVDWREVRAADAARGARRMVSTLNLLPYVDDDASCWIPAPLDLSVFDYLRECFAPAEDAPEVLVSHTPTRRDYKGTETLLSVVEGLRSEGLPLRVVLTERKSRGEALRDRAGCHVTYDQPHLCYGNSGLEGMAFGQPTIVGPPESVRAIVRRVVGPALWADEPYVYARTREELSAVLVRLVEDRVYRRFWGQVGRAYVEAFHAAPMVAQMMADVYESL